MGNNPKDEAKGVSGTTKRPKRKWRRLVGLAIFLVALAFNLLGDAVRDVADPRTRRAGS